MWRGALLENARYPAVSAELTALRGERPLTAPVTVLAGDDGSGGRAARGWLAEQAGLAATLGARFEVARPAGHHVMADLPAEVARTVLEAGTGAP